MTNLQFLLASGDKLPLKCSVFSSPLGRCFKSSSRIKIGGGLSSKIAALMIISNAVTLINAINLNAVANLKSFTFPPDGSERLIRHIKGKSLSNYASPSSGEAYRDRQLTPNFVL